MKKALKQCDKKGMSWHGTMLHMKQESEDGNKSNYIEDLITTYYDHTSDGDFKKKIQALITMCEDMLCRIEKDYPHVHEVIFQSVNDRFYENSMLLFGLILMTKSSEKLKINNLINSETEDEKCSIDALFSVTIGHIMRHVNQVNDVIFPVQLAHALSRDIQLKNSLAELFSFSRQQVENLIVDHQCSFNLCNKNIKRNNEAACNYDLSTITTLECSKIENTHKVACVNGDE